jgi:hypothetical protein
MLRVASVSLSLIVTFPVAGVLSNSALQGEVSGWPESFRGQATKVHWNERSVDIGGLRMRVSVPANWSVRIGSPSSEPLIAMDVKAGHRLEIAETKPTTFILDQPVSEERLQQSIKTMQSAVPHGYVVEEAGQVRIRERWWLWHESRISTFAASILPSYTEMLREVPYGSARSWSFIGTPESRLVRVYCTVMYPKDITNEEVDLRTRDAGAVFAAILQRLAFGAL